MGIALLLNVSYCACFLLCKGPLDSTLAVAGSTESQPYPSVMPMQCWDTQPPFGADACPMPT